MGKIKASLADVSTEFFPIDPGEYEMEVVKVEETTSEDGRTVYAIVSKVSDPGDFHGRQVWDRIHIHKKDGELNPVGLAQLKRYFEAVVGEERANSDDVDTDELIGGTFQAEVTIESYKDKQGKDRQNNRLRVFPPA
jgi:hypothetical protein